MTGFFSKLFGGKKKTGGNASNTVELVEEILGGLFDKAGFELKFNVRTDGGAETEEITVELSGSDEELLTEKEGGLLDALQLFIKRVTQHQLPDARVNVSFDCNGFREESNRELVELAEKLRDKALEQGRSVYLRALPPKDRKIVHQYLANDERVRSRSVGDGLYKKIKIYPVKNGARDTAREEDAQTTNA
jgi:spoIIIJ-associated protein